MRLRIGGLAGHDGFDLEMMFSGIKGAGESTLTQTGD